MGRLFRHVVVYAVINAFLVAMWLLTTGSVADLRTVASDPSAANRVGFWPVWPILAWGAVVLLHVGTAIPDILSGRSAARRRRRKAKQAKKAARAGRDLVRDVTTAGTDIVREVGAAIDKAHGRRVDKREREGVEPLPGPPPAGPQRRWVTVLFTDISDSTKHNEDLGDEEWHRILAHVRTVVRSALTARGGDEVGTQGDGTLARFDSPADAVLCAIDIQSELSTARDASGFVPGVRIGVHAGEAVHDEGDLIGRVINLASRVMGEAQPGEILVTEPVADQLVGKLELEDRGLRPLKGLSQPRHLLAVKWSGEQA